MSHGITLGMKYIVIIWIKYLLLLKLFPEKQFSPSPFKLNWIVLILSNSHTTGPKQV
ncbi:hypothetical protein RchiOBHm_Chr3g0495511 [Rosa chinensis]|uniref:Uncharacterized protein n=1 Tax=Rosa chinensis TaxID=74649 RepID=A0A2P6RH90_ROSCH|nr:hypothetical protein RchiOBHm_Chr3g0495511 [Rosa chinensis]